MSHGRWRHRLTLAIPALLLFLVILAVIPVLRRVFKVYHLVQPIRKELPDDQHRKLGTPLMGGLVFLLAGATAVYVQPAGRSMLLGTALCLFALVGFADDLRKVRTKRDGISANAKLGWQFVITGTLLYYLLRAGMLGAQLSIARGVVLQLPGGVFFAAVALIIVGATNAINFTDGLDGLLVTISIPSYFFFFVISRSADVRTFCLMMMVSLLAFLFYNRFPASIIMGDTGSMAIGGTLAFLGVLEHVVILLPLLFFVYLAEILSVIIQVGYFKRTGRRIFRMSPIHYHFGLKYGWDENRIVLVFSAVSWICALLCIVYYYAWMR